MGSVTQRKAGEGRTEAGKARAGQVCVCVQVCSAWGVCQASVFWVCIGCGWCCFSPPSLWWWCFSFKKTNYIKLKYGKVKSGQAMWWSSLLLLGVAAFPLSLCGWCWFPIFLLWCGAAFTSFGWCCFSASFCGNVLLSLSLLAGTAISLPLWKLLFLSLFWVVMLSFKNQITSN